MWRAGLLLALALACGRSQRPAHDAGQAVDEASDAGAAREGAAENRPPVAAPRELPLIGPNGVDAFGYPLRGPDVVALRALLARRSFGELTDIVESFQSAFEADWRKEGWVVDVADAFDGDENAPLLDEWVQAAPTSFAPYLARGTALLNAGYQRRGTEVAKETTVPQFEAMRELHARARVDLARALELRPTLVAAHGNMLRLMRSGGFSRADKRRSLDAALATCPHCTFVRLSYAWTLLPRWGGSYEQLEAFAAESAADKQNPRHAVIVGMADFDRGRTGSKKNDLTSALAALDRAVARAPSWRFLVERGVVRWKAGDLAGARADFDAAVAAAPTGAEPYRRRAELLIATERYEDAAADAGEAARLEPAEPESREMLNNAINGLKRAAGLSFQAGNFVEAGRFYQSVLLLAPDDKEALEWGRRAQQNAEAAIPTIGEQGPELTFEQALARDGESKDYPATVKMWNRYLDRHPDDARAFLERCGTYTQLRNFPSARDDCQRACELRLKEGCEVVNKLDARPGGDARRQRGDAGVGDRD